MGFGVGLLLHAKIANKNVTAKFLSSECREKLVFTLLSRDKIRLKVKFSGIKNQNTPSPESILNTRKIVSGLFGRHADFTQGSLDECYVVHNSKAVVVKSEAFEAPDKESIKQIINDVIEKLRT